MKKIMLFIAALLVFCIAPISATQAVPRQTHGEDNRAFALSVFNQEDISGLDAEPGGPVFKNNLLTRAMQHPEAITIAQSGKSTTTTSTGKTNPHVKRRGHGRSKMRTAGVDKDNNSQKTDIGDGEENGGENDVQENEAMFGDDSAVKFNRDLKNSSGYNEDL
jgi:hypothetical protein